MCAWCRLVVNMLVGYVICVGWWWLVYTTEVAGMWVRYADGWCLYAIVVGYGLGVFLEIVGWRWRVLGGFVLDGSLDWRLRDFKV